jgi:hypothetical protein
MPQYNNFLPAKSPTNVPTAMKLDASGNLLVRMATPLASQSALNISAATVIKATPGTLVNISVVVAGVAGSINDCATTGAAAVSNKIGVVPAVVGVVPFNWPCNVGITYTPGAGQVVAISYV